MNRIEQLYQERSAAAGFALGYLDYLKELFDKLDPDAIAGFIEILLQARERQARIYFIGNGGSAATASHFANDIAIGTRSWDRPFRAISLTDNVAVITAIGNDYGYSEIFVSQLKAVMEPNDVVVAISASGNSPNIIEAVQYANEQGAVTVGLSGFDGGKLKQIARHCVHVPTNSGEYGPVEDIHLILDHLVGSFLINKCSSPNRQV
jgi:D-sedoheptulose 7-phosphate isomerase